MDFWDTSALIKLYTEEPDSAEFESYLADSSETPVISRLALYEFRRTISRKEFESLIRRGSAETIYDTLVNDIEEGKIEVIQFSEAFEENYALILKACFRGKDPVVIRTLDAIHLTAATSANADTLVCTDRIMRRAALKLNLSLYPPP